MKTVLLKNPESGKIVLNKGDKLTYLLFGDDGWDKANLEFDIKGGELDFYSFIIGRGSGEFPIEIVARHLTPGSVSRFNCRAALFDNSKVDCAGKLIVDKSARLSETYLTHRTLLLSDRAQARVIPSMEIMADDVKAGHAATIGKTDKELMFYFNSRGIDVKVAENLLIAAFFEEQIQMIPDLDLRQELQDLILRALPFSKDLTEIK